MSIEEKDMKQFDGIWFPAHEEHMLEWMTEKNVRVDGHLTYQWSKIEASLKHVRQFRVAVDVGAHVGLWSMHLAKRFETIHAFEPVAVHRECFRRNVPGNHVTVYGCAIGEKQGMIDIEVPRGSSGGSHVKGDGAIPMVRLDDFPLQNVDFLKLDCEGYELFALRGGEQLLLRCRPAIIVEQKPGRAQQFGLGERDAVPYLESLGAKLRKEIGGDFIMSWDK